MVSHQKKINVTKPETIRPDIKKRDPYTPYQDPQGFIYVDNQGRNRLIRSDELYKFSDGTLTRLRTSLDDIRGSMERCRVVVKGAAFQGGDKELLGVQGGDGGGRVVAWWSQVGDKVVC
ncbi:hypothetical protein Tco_1354544 [Tanacetum coccineum]